MKTSNVVIGHCSLHTVSTRFYTSMLDLVTYELSTGKHLMCLPLNQQPGPYIHIGRNELVRQFLSLPNAEWLLMVDTDQVLPSNLVDLLLQSGKSVVAAWVEGYRGKGKTIMAYNWNDQTRLYDALLPGQIKTDGPTKVDAVGSSTLLVNRRVLECLRKEYPEPYPWFDTGDIDGKPLGDDLEFCRRIKESTDYDIYVDGRVQIPHEKPMLLGIDL